MGDLISRDYVLSEYDRQHNGPPGGARKIMEEAPTVDATPVVHGRWKEQYMYYACSVCGAEYNDEIVLLYEGDSNNGLFSGFEYCPHCGAKMDGSDSDGNRQ